MLKYSDTSLLEREIVKLAISSYALGATPLLLSLTNLTALPIVLSEKVTPNLVSQMGRGWFELTYGG